MAEPTVQVPVSTLKRIVYHAQQTTSDIVLAQEVARLIPDDAPPTAEPPRIEDLAPGTTFRAKHVDPEECGNAMRTWFVFGLRRVILFNDWGQRWSVDSIDPSTIRDVTPPKESTHD